MTKDTITEPTRSSFGDIPLTREEQIDRLLSRWPELEAELEAAGRNERLEELLIDYVKDLHHDNSIVRILRNFVVIASAILLTFLWSGLQSYLKLISTLEPSAQVAFVIGLFALTGLLATTVLRGAFKLAKDRHQDDLPDNIKTIINGTNMTNS